MLEEEESIFSLSLDHSFSGFHLKSHSNLFLSDSASNPLDPYLPSEVINLKIYFHQPRYFFRICVQLSLHFITEELCSAIIIAQGSTRHPDTDHVVSEEVNGTIFSAEVGTFHPRRNRARPVQSNSLGRTTLQVGQGELSRSVSCRKEVGDEGVLFNF
ncbi:hypothetical protein NPIL_248201 [Nephila pilipes]|uniref:Uncharacterized protein n=1 Tax=Nephila pilipes TaxID=299642 RepID=A0A8X6PLE8_NEPPI|nr:hypothetical protein NPIL_248201 [Nephila pilipes]